MLLGKPVTPNVSPFSGRRQRERSDRCAGPTATAGWRVSNLGATGPYFRTTSLSGGNRSDGGPPPRISLLGKIFSHKRPALGSRRRVSQTEARDGDPAFRDEARTIPWPA